MIATQVCFSKNKVRQFVYVAIVVCNTVRRLVISSNQAFKIYSTIKQDYTTV